MPCDIASPMIESSTERRFRLIAPPRPSWRGYLVRLAVFMALTGVTAAGALGVGAYLYFAPTVPQFASMADYQPKLGARLYSADGQLIGEFATERRVMVPAEKIPPLLYQAFIAAEDKRFFSHGGVDLIGIFQALVGKVLRPGEKLRGASTITQQVAKSLLVTRESYASATSRTFSRKIREAILARRLEASLTKFDILYLYVSQIFFGHKAYGVQAAAENYFRKNVWELTLAEAATLAGLPQRPSDYSPWSRPQAAAGRRKYVLRRMAEDGYITAAERDAAEAERLKVYGRKELYLSVAPYYTEQVRRLLLERYGERALLEDGLQIYTGLNVMWQSYARDAVEQALRDLDKRQGFRGPLAHLETPADRRAFHQAYRSYLGLDGAKSVQVKEGRVYLAVVAEIGTRGWLATVDIAGTQAYLPLAGMRWARPPNPTQRVDLHYLSDLSKAVAVGDVIAVRGSSRETLRRDAHGAGVMSTVPKKEPIVALEQDPIAQAALLAVDPRSGYVAAQVGGFDFAESTYNRAVQACREPGSAFKPVAYSAAIDKLDYTASTLIDDKPIIFDDPDNAVRWKPNNAGMTFRGPLPLRTCLKDSINTPAIRIAEAVGIDDIIKNAHRLGITTELKRELGTALGSSCTTLFDLINVYVTINQYGKRRPLHFIRRVVDRYGNVLEDHTVPWDPTLDLAARLDGAYREVVAPPEQVLDEQTAFLMTNLLRNVVREGTGMGASRTGHSVAGKTGTTNDSYDAWFMGFTRNMVAGVWVGHDKKERPLGVGEQGGRTALPAWVTFTTHALLDYTADPVRRIPQGDFEPPTGVVEAIIDPETGLLARPGAPRSVSEYYRAGTAPTEFAPDRSVINPSEFDLFGADTPL